MKSTVIVLLLLTFICLPTSPQASVVICYPDLPAPELQLVGIEDFEISGNLYTRYIFDVANWFEFPEELWAPSPDLPPCGLNTSAPRTWVTLYAADGTRLMGYCQTASSSGLAGKWFSVPQGTPPPEEVYMVLNDRACDWDYVSNLVSTRCLPDLPLPVIEFVGTEDYTTPDGVFTRYIMDVTNWEDYPAVFFEPRPDLPPCGLNVNASRAWVRIYYENGDYAYGFCALSSPSELQGIFHSVPGGSDPPNLYIEIWDRECDIVYRSNTIFGVVPTGAMSWGALKSAFE